VVALRLQLGAFPLVLEAILLGRSECRRRYAVSSASSPHPDASRATE
jgi:hypothetical protein